MSDAGKMTCPACAAEMNHHAVKIEYEGDDAPPDSIFEGPLKDIHTCPQCGHIEMREAS